MLALRSLAFTRTAVTQRALLSTSAVRSKSVIDSVKETVDNVNKKVGQTLAAGIEKTEKVTSDAKSIAGDHAPDMEHKAKVAQEQVRSNAASVAGKAEEMRDEAKNKL